MEQNLGEIIIYQADDGQTNINVKMQDAESVLSRLGIPMATAVDMYLNQIVLVGGIPFSVTLPSPPSSIDATEMNDEQIQDEDFLNNILRDEVLLYEE